MSAALECLSEEYRQKKAQLQQHDEGLRQRRKIEPRGVRCTVVGSARSRSPVAEALNRRVRQILTML